jgi:metal-responsive CopG/Arc/MetJ family transcriptional regulator
MVAHGEEYQGEPIRHSISFPQELYDELKEISRKQYRSLTSIVLEACDYYVSGRLHDETIRYLKSEEGRKLIKKILEEEEN